MRRTRGESGRFFRFALFLGFAFALDLALDFVFAFALGFALALLFAFAFGGAFLAFGFGG